VALVNKNIAKGIKQITLPSATDYPGRDS